MGIFEKIIKIIACFLLMFFDLAAFGFRIGLSGWWRRTQHHGKIYNNVFIAGIILYFCGVIMS